MSPLPPPPHVSQAQVRRLTLQVSRRLDGLMHGNHARLALGSGSEPAEARAYTLGDDTRRIDWAVTARTGETHVRTTTADRELETTLLVDLSASMAFGTRGSEKRDLALAVGSALVHLTSSHGDRVGALVLTGEGTRRLPARAGRDAGMALRHALERTPRTAVGTGGDLAEALRLLARPPRRRGLVVVLSDLLEVDAGPTPRWARPLALLAQRCDVVVCQVQDPRERELPDVGTLQLVDPETGRQLEVRTTPALRARYAAAARARADAQLAAVRSARAAHVLLSTDRDWLPELARHLTVRRRTTGSAGSRATALPVAPGASRV